MATLMAASDVKEMRIAELREKEINIMFFQ
jgi:hypothetical protein